MSSKLVFLTAAIVAATGCASTAPSLGAVSSTPATSDASAFLLPTDAFSSEASHTEEASGAEAEASDAAAEPRSQEVPTSCANPQAEICTPPVDWVERLCKKRTPDLALSLFQGDSPWTRAYVQRDMEAWYASARRSSPKQLRYAEEVIIVADRSTTDSGIQVSGFGSFDVYRWDGSCVSLMSHEVTTKRPSTPDVATINWKRLDDNVQEALEKNKKIAFRNMKRRKDCKELGEQGVRRCERAELGLSRMIAEYVRKGGPVPQAKLLP